MTTQLRPMLEDEFHSYIDHLVEDYAKDNVEAGYWQEGEALERSRKETGNLLPQGVKTPSHYLYVIEDNSLAVGVIWMRVDPKAAVKGGFIFDLEINQQYRGKGFGKKAMLLIEEKAKEFGLRQIELHVFAKNKVARKLYGGLGYQVTSLNMTKKLGD